MTRSYCHRKLASLNMQQRIVCVDCGKHYTTMYNMRQHRNIHTRRNLYKCSHCGKEFTHKHVWEVSTVRPVKNSYRVYSFYAIL